jgi:hypothetical protein
LFCNICIGLVRDFTIMTYLFSKWLTFIRYRESCQSGLQLALFLRKWSGELVTLLRGPLTGNTVKHCLMATKLCVLTVNTVLNYLQEQRTFGCHEGFCCLRLLIRKFNPLHWLPSYLISALKPSISLNYVY